MTDRSRHREKRYDEAMWGRPMPAPPNFLLGKSALTVVLYTLTVRIVSGTYGSVLVNLEYLPDDAESPAGSSNPSAAPFFALD